MLPLSKLNFAILIAKRLVAGIMVFNSFCFPQHSRLHVGLHTATLR